MTDKDSGASRSNDSRRGQLIAIGVLALLLVAVLIFVSQSGDDPNQSRADASKSTAELLGGITQSGTTLGESTAPVTLTEFGDPQCPFCAKFADDVLPKLVTDYVAKGQLKIDYQPLTFIGPDSVTAARTAAALIPQHYYWSFIDLFYRQQQQENTGYVTQDYLKSLIEQIPGADADKALQQADLPSSDKLIADAKAEAEKLRVSSTPTLFLSTGNGKLQELKADPSDGDAVVSEVGTAVDAQ